MNPISNPEQEIDNFINNGDNLFTPEQLRLMKKVNDASKLMITRLQRLKRAGIDTSERELRAKEIKEKSDKILREFSN